jgi:hypothetical protein
VSDTSAGSGAPARQKPSFRLSMTKPARPGPDVPSIKPPRTIDYVTAALVVMCVAGLARALLLFGNTSTLLAYVTKQNAKAKHPDKTFDAVKAVHQFRESTLISAVVVGIALLLLAWALRRPRSASPSRWAMLIVFFFTGLPFYIVPTSGLPGGASGAGVIIGLAAVAAVVLIFVPKPSVQYFKECREASMPPERRGQARPGLGSLFKPRPPRATTSTPPSSASKPEATNASAAPKAKAKVRTDDAAIAKGADLARSRAKASKSRRTTG